MSKKNKQSDYLQKLSASQNFITSGKLLHRIVNLSSITRQDTVIEIGTGKGHLTRALCQKCGFLYSIEIDRKLYQHAKKRLAGCQNLKFSGLSAANRNGLQSICQHSLFHHNPDHPQIDRSCLSAN